MASWVSNYTVTFPQQSDNDVCRRSEQTKQTHVVISAPPDGPGRVLRSEVNNVSDQTRHILTY